MGWKSSSIETFAGKVRAAARRLGANGNEFSAADLGHAAGVQTFDGNRRLHWAIRDLKNAGELVAVHKGVYRLNQDQPARKRGEKRLVMWRFLRANRRVSVEDLQEIAAVSAAYAREWLQALVRLHVVAVRADGRFELLHDVVEQPRNDRKAEKLRKMRAEQKANIIAVLDDAQMRLQEAGQRLDEARGGLNALDE